MKPRRPAPHVVYEAIDADGCVLYVGTTANIHVRLMGHRSQSPWWVDMEHMRITPAPNRVVALETERALITEHRPPFNTDGCTPRAERGTRISQVLGLLIENGPMTTTELKAAMDGYYNTSVIVTRLHAEGTIKAIDWLHIGRRTGYAGVWAPLDHPAPAVPHPTAQVAA